MENTQKNNEKSKQEQQEIDKAPVTPLFEDLKKHDHEDESFKKLMKEQENRKKTKTGI